MAMFDSKKKKGSTGVDTLVGPHTEIRGDVLFAGGLHVDGRIKGKVLAQAGADAALSISETGFIEGDVSVPTIRINGSVSGNVHASGKVTLAPKAHVAGNVFYKVLEVQPGAEVNGQLVHDPDGSRNALQPSDGRPTEPVLVDVRELRRPKAS
jgi:cytoskeletal protein CcmA (bactofilin family)